MLRTLRMSVVVEAVVVKYNFNKSLECRDKKSKSPFFFFFTSPTPYYHHHQQHNIIIIMTIAYILHTSIITHTNHPPSPFFTITTPKPKLILKILGRYNNNLTTTQLQKRNNNNLGVIVRWVKQKLPTHIQPTTTLVPRTLVPVIMCVWSPLLPQYRHPLNSITPGPIQTQGFKTGLKGG